MLSYSNPAPNTLTLEKSRNDGFTLIELMLVFAVIAILAAITFGISRGVKDAQSRAKAQAELVVLTQALENFKASNSDFPWAKSAEESSAEELFKALLGWKQFDFSDPDNPLFEDKEDVPPQGPKAFLDTSNLTYIETGKPNVFNPELIGNSAPDDHLLIDPWGNPYRYYYKTQSSPDAWENYGFVLYSMGPDGEHAPVGENGILTDAIRAEEENIDNIYVGG